MPLRGLAVLFAGFAIISKHIHSQNICLFGIGRVLGCCSLACFPLHMRAHAAAHLCITCTYRAFQTDFFAVALFSSDSDSHQFDPPS